MEKETLLAAAQRAAAATAQSQMALYQSLSSMPQYAGKILGAKNGREVRELVRQLLDEIADQKATVATAEDVPTPAPAAE